MSLGTDYKCIVVDAAEDMVEAINIIKENILSRHIDYFSADYEHMLDEEEEEVIYGNEASKEKK